MTALEWAIDDEEIEKWVLDWEQAVNARIKSVKRENDLLHAHLIVYEFLCFHRYHTSPTIYCARAYIHRCGRLPFIIPLYVFLSVSFIGASRTFYSFSQRNVSFHERQQKKQRVRIRINLILELNSSVWGSKKKMLIERRSIFVCCCPERTAEVGQIVEKKVCFFLFFFVLTRANHTQAL